MNIRKSYEYDYIEEVYEEKVYNYRILLINDETNHFGYVEDNLMVICFKTKREAKALAREWVTVLEKLTYKKLTVSMDH